MCKCYVFLSTKYVRWNAALVLVVHCDPAVKVHAPVASHLHITVEYMWLCTRLVHIMTPSFTQGVEVLVHYVSRGVHVYFRELDNIFQGGFYDSTVSILPWGALFQ